jgi:ATP-dependent DNA helicase DinG
MMVRQGAGRLIRKAEDLGIIALLDARLVTKPYGEEIIDNLPSDLRRFNSISDAAGWIGLPPLRFDP